MALSTIECSDTKIYSITNFDHPDFIMPGIDNTVKNLKIYWLSDSG